MSPSQDSRDVVSYATPPPNTKPGLTCFPQFLSARNSTQVILIVIGLDSTHPIIPKQIGAIRGTLHLFYQRSRWQARSRDEVVDEDLRKPFKEARRTPFTRRIIEFAGPEYKMPTNIKLYDGTTDPKDHLSRFAGAANSGEWPMLVWCRMFQQTLDGSARGWFERLPRDSINEWAELRDEFAARYSVRRACFKEPHEITKIVRKANESLTTFKERWTVETGFIMGVPEVMKISSSWIHTELPKGETGKTHRIVSLPFSGRDASPFRNIRLMESRRDDYRNNYRGRDGYHTNRARDDRALYPSARGEYNRRVAAVLTLNSLTKYPKEILATETQLRLPAPGPMINPLRSGNIDRYCEYHQEKGHYTNDYIQLRKQLKMALESGKLNHMVKDVRQRGRGSHGRDDPQPAKIINVIIVNLVKDKKRNVREATESWMNVLISFMAIPSDDIFEEPLIVEAEVKGYLVRRVYVDEGSSVEVMFEHSPSPYNIILGRPEMKTLRAIPSTIHSMMKFPTPKGVATLVTRTVIIAECRRLERKQMIEEERPKGEGEVAVTEEVLVNPSFPDQLVTIGGGLSDAARDQLKCLLKDNLGVFAWEPSDMIGVPHQIIEHALNVNPSLDPVCQKRRTFSTEKSGV
ncbi:reverse transcriptase domain-containing protein [Tanacetum coccineum]|uniref:Reverse transcriptase domain-containing protein n=1 Tax=Tanacetum coccineum TaxID=301880 RepID=A0ABQ5I387_9ASTR